MWQLENRTPYAAERTWVRDLDGAEIWVVAVKCSFDIGPGGEMAIAAVQPPVSQAPEFTNPAAGLALSLKYDMDLVRTKLTTDVVLNGHAYAPRGEAVSALDVGLRIGPVTKRLRVTGDRVWLGDSPSLPRPFTAMPMVYERAYGGIDPGTRDSSAPRWDVRNPAGTGFALDASHIEGLRLPNIEYPDQCVTAWSDRPQPACFAPLCNHWQPRVALAGTYDDAWRQDQLPLLPRDFDDRHYQCAPQDQQAPDFLVGGELAMLIHLSPHAEQLCFELPTVVLGFETSFSDGGRVRHGPANLHTVILEPDESRLSMVWHSALHCHAEVHRLLRTCIVEVP
ncbi:MULTISPECIES: DUF2169 family type VI secretion system accessory protein [unclassified Variovorax]|uniref:DUF2169 family type VI secretion system accessory protein n=1 Tax=unclassified Variovorax TaxID=663243 RepID=UPI003F45834D